MTKDNIAPGGRSIDSFGSSRARWLASPDLDRSPERDRSQDALFWLGYENRKRYHDLMTRNTDDMVAATTVAAIESLALFTHPLDPTSNVDTTSTEARRRLAYISRRRAELTGRLSPIADKDNRNVAFIGSYGTVSEVDAFVSHIEIDTGLLERTPDRIHTKDEKRKAIYELRDAFQIHRPPGNYYGIDPTYPAAQAYLGELVNSSPHLPQEFIKSIHFLPKTLADFIEMDLSQFSTIVWARAEPEIVLGNDESIFNLVKQYNDSQIRYYRNRNVGDLQKSYPTLYKPVKDVINGLMKKLVSEGELYVTVGRGNYERGKLLRDMFINLVQGVAFNKNLDYTGFYDILADAETGSVLDFGLGDLASVTIRKKK